MTTSTASTRTQALTLAWHIVKTVRLPFVKAQAQAWATVKLKAQMQAGPVGFWYIKDDGTTRFAIGHFIPQPTPSDSGKATNPLVVRYFDTLSNGWRSFRADRLVTA